MFGIWIVRYLVFSISDMSDIWFVRNRISLESDKFGIWEFRDLICSVSDVFDIWHVRYLICSVSDVFGIWHVQYLISSVSESVNRCRRHRHHRQHWEHYSAVSLTPLSYWSHRWVNFLKTKGPSYFEDNQTKAKVELAKGIKFLFSGVSDKSHFTYSQIVCQNHEIYWWILWFLYEHTPWKIKTGLLLTFVKIL